jgi:hypothetical protein
MNECKNTNSTNYNLVSASFQAITFVISLIVLGLLLAVRYQTFINRDPTYRIEQHTESNYQTITTGLHLVNFSKFFVSQNIFEFVGTVWFAYDPNIVSLDVIKQFQIHNGSIVDISEPSITQTSKQTIARFRVHGKFSSDLYYMFFPFDDHSLHLVISNDFLPKNVIFVSQPNLITMDPSLQLPGWRIKQTTTTSGYSDWLHDIDTNDISEQMIFTLMIEHANPMLALNIVLTLLLLLFISLLTFSSDQDCVLIVTVGMVALIGYRFVLQSFEPPFINYFTLADYMYLFALTGTILTLFGGIMARERGHSLIIKKLFIIGIYTLFVGGCSLMSFML